MGALPGGTGCFGTLGSRGVGTFGTDGSFGVRSRWSSAGVLGTNRQGMRASPLSISEVGQRLLELHAFGPAQLIAFVFGSIETLQVGRQLDAFVDHEDAAPISISTFWLMPYRPSSCRSASSADTLMTAEPHLRIDVKTFSGTGMAVASSSSAT